MLTQYAFSILFIDKKKAKFSNDRFGIKTTQIYTKITNKKIEENMAKFFNDKTINSLCEESVNMTAKDKNTTRAKNKKKGGTQASAQA